MKQFMSFLRKEFIHILRDRRTMLILLLIPVLLIVIFGYAVTTEINEAPFAVYDQSHDDLTRKAVERLDAGEFFRFKGYVENMEEADRLFREGKVRMVIVFPPDYSASPDSRAQLLTDATDPNEATQLSAYATAILSAMRMEAEGMQPRGRLVAVPHLLYNPQMKGAYNFVPGVMGLILILICAMMTSVSIVREKEIGTMEVLLVSPLRPHYILLAKALPYLLLSLVNILTILLLSRFLLDVPIRGSVCLVIVLSLIYSLLSLCLGLLISTVADSQQSAMLISGVALMLPVMLLSGMIFPIENMPWPLQWLANVVPAKWYIIAVKDVMIKGLGLADILKEVGILCLMIVFLMGVSLKRFNIRLQ